MDETFSTARVIEVQPNLKDTPDLYQHYHAASNDILNFHLLSQKNRPDDLEERDAYTVPRNPNNAQRFDRVARMLHSHAINKEFSVLADLQFRGLEMPNFAVGAQYANLGISTKVLPVFTEFLTLPRVRSYQATLIKAMVDAQGQGTVAGEYRWSAQDAIAAYASAGRSAESDEVDGFAGAEYVHTGERATVAVKASSDSMLVGGSANVRLTTGWFVGGEYYYSLEKNDYSTSLGITYNLLDKVLPSTQYSLWRSPALTATMNILGRVKISASMPYGDDLIVAASHVRELSSDESYTQIGAMYQISPEGVRLRAQVDPYNGASAGVQMKVTPGVNALLSVTKGWGDNDSKDWGFGLMLRSES